MQRIPLDSPWKVNECVLFNNEYLSVNQLAKMLHVPARDVMYHSGKTVVTKIPNCRQFRRFISVENLRTVLMSMKKDYTWLDESTIDRCLAQINDSKATPYSLETNNDKEEEESSSSSSYEDVESEEEPLRVIRKRGRPRKEGGVHIASAVAFLNEIRQYVGTQAVQAYMLTDDYQQKCREAIQERLPRLELMVMQQLRPQVEETLRCELAPVVERKLREEFLRKRPRSDYELINELL